MRYAATGMIALAIAIGAVVATGGGGGGGGGGQYSSLCSSNMSAANVWVNLAGAGGSPSRSASQISYNATNAYGDLGSAYSAATAGDMIRVISSSTTTTQEIDYSSGKNATATQTYICSSNGVVQLRSLLYGDCNTLNAPTYLTIDGGTNRDIKVGGAGSSYAGGGFSACNGQQDVVANMQFCVAESLTGPCFEWREAYATTIAWNIIGPACCGYNGTHGSTPWNMLLAVCNDPPNCTQGVNPFSGYADNNLIVDHNIFRGNSRFCDAWDATWGGTYGTCSANSFVTCPDSTQCHGDCIHSWGERGSTFSNNQFLHCATQAFFLEESSGGANVSGTIENNYFTKLQTEGAQAGFGGGTGSHGIWGGWCADSCFGHPTGTWNIRYNTAIGTADVGVDLGCSVFGMQCHYGTSTINVVGNTGFAFYGNDSNTCTGGSEAGNGNPNTLTYAYHANVWTSDSDPHVNSGIPDTCDATDSAVTRATATGWYNDANPPTLNTSANPPIGFVGTGATYCTGTDYNGHARSGSTCNAGLLNQ